MDSIDASQGVEHMHEYKRLLQRELDMRGWSRAELSRASGLSRQLITRTLNDSREHLGQMPADLTIERFAKGFGISVDAVRVAAARSLSGYVGDETQLGTALEEVPLDALLQEIRRRVERVNREQPSAATGAQPEEP